MTDLASHWQLDPEITFLNHGSYGACPTEVLDRQTDLQKRIEREPVAFFMREFEGLLQASRHALATFVGVPGEDLAFVPNATTAVNTVLRSLAADFEPGDELLTTDHVYNACRNAMQFVASKSGARVVIAPTPFPLADPQQVVDAVLSHVTEATRLVLLDHVTSPTGLILPVEKIVPALRERGIDTLVDGAHAPGMVDLDIGALAPTYYTGNCHKWLCTPKGAALLYVQPDRQAKIRPLSISHGANSPRTDRSRFLLEFDWPGTTDPTAYLCIPSALEFMGALFAGGWQELRAKNRDLVLRGRALLCETLAVEPPAPESMIGSLASVPIPDGIDPLQDNLYHDDHIEVPIMTWPLPPQRLLRISAQAYNREDQYAKLAHALHQHLAK